MKFRHPSDAEMGRLLLADAIADIHARSRGTYGMSHPGGPRDRAGPHRQQEAGLEDHA
jgi:hypothetical protein